MTTTKRGHCCSRSAFGKVRFSGHKFLVTLCKAEKRSKNCLFEGSLDLSNSLIGFSFNYPRHLLFFSCSANVSFLKDFEDLNSEIGH